MTYCDPGVALEGSHDFPFPSDSVDSEVEPELQIADLTQFCVNNQIARCALTEASMYK